MQETQCSHGEHMSPLETKFARHELGDTIKDVIKRYQVDGWLYIEEDHSLKDRPFVKYTYSIFAREAQVRQK
jgi:hypothetical protein